mmetsp:Transcript_73005/g.101533  ORF Transcript_73005/g.101533 Transcript_73005/m.101533 type:complete len:154 (-) Transcript_73005:181-642(-)
MSWTTSSSSSSKKQVCFGDLEIRSYGIVLGDHPNVSNGAPIQIGWDFHETQIRNLDLYEVMRGERRRGKKQLSIPVQKRGQMLLRAGYTLDEIGSAALEASECRKLRADSLKNQGWESARLVLETTGRIPKDILGGMANILRPKRKTVQARSA